MSTDICLPRVSPDDAAVTLAKWHVKVGSRVSPGDVIAEIESDKAIVELEAEEAGVITEIRVAEGSNDVRADQVLAVIDEADEGSEPSSPDDATARHSDPIPPAAGAGSLANDAVNEVSKPEDSRARPSPQGNALFQRPADMAQPRASHPGNGASPLAARMARQAGIDLHGINGSGPGGRILADDVRAALGPAPVGVSAHRAEPVSVDGDTAFHGGFEPEFDIQTPDNMRRAIAERLAQSKRDAPHFYMSLDCRAGALLDLRESLTVTGAQVSLNDLILKVTAATLVRVPELNAAWSDTGIRRFRSVDLAVAVAIPGGLITPVIRRAHEKRLAAIAAEMRDLATRARAGRLAREEYQGGTFTVSNMGMYGVERFTAVINPPQAAILAVGAVGERAVAENGSVGTASMMTLTLSVDHRVSDGAAAAEFLQNFKRLAEDPRLLLL